MAILLLSSSVAGAATLNDVRVWDEPSQTRLILDLNQAIEPHVFTLDNPHRVVVDLPDVAHGAPEVAGEGLVRRVRFGRQQSGLRVVFDLTESARPNTYQLPPSAQYGHRVVIELPRAQPDQARDPIVALVDKTVVVAIDPGHGGEDPGATGPSGVREKTVALEIARRLKTLIDAEPGMQAVLTRDGDYFVPLRKRMQRAQKARADLFVSIHADAFRDRRVHGSSVYVLSPRGASSEYARVLANRENAADLIGGVEIKDKDELLASVLLDISQSAAIEASIDLAGRVLQQLGEAGKLHKTSVQRAGFAVLKAPDVPSILVETAFISNPDEERRLKSSAHQERLARHLRNGILSYFEAYRPQRVVAQAER